jgi:hypothetical protein
MSLAMTDARRLSQDLKLAGTVESVALVDRLFEVIAFVACTSIRGLIHEREKTAPVAHFIAAGGAVAESAASFDEVVTKLRQITDDVDIPGAVYRYGNNLNNQLATQTAYKARAAARAFSSCMINGGFGTVALTATNVTGVALATGGTGPRTPLSADVGTGRIKQLVAAAVKTLAYWAPGDTGYGPYSVDMVSPANPQGVVLRSLNGTQWIKVNVTTASLAAGNVEDADVACTSATQQFDGVDRMCDPDQILAVVNTNGDLFTLARIHELIDACVAPPGTQKFLITSKRGARMITAVALAAAGGATPPTVALPWYGITKGAFPAVLDTPILITDAVGNAETVGTSANCETLYCVALGIPNGVPEEAPQRGPGLFAMYGASGLSAQAMGRTLMGMWLQDLGYIEGFDLYRTRIGWDCGLIHYAKQGIALRRGFTPLGA